MNLKIEELIDKALLEKNNKREKHKQVSWHASGLGGCLRGQFFSRLGVEPDYTIDERTLRVFDMGNKIEDWVVDLISTQDNIVGVETQVRIEDKKLNVSGYADLVLEFRNEKIAYEIKSKHSRSFWYLNKQGAQRGHEYQLWIYLYVLGIKKGKIVYISKDDLAIMEFEVNINDEQLKKEVFEILGLLNVAWKKQDPLLLPLPKKDSWQSKYCSYHKRCLKIEYDELTKKVEKK